MSWSLEDAEIEVVGSVCLQPATVVADVGLLLLELEPGGVALRARRVVAVELPDPDGMSGCRYGQGQAGGRDGESDRTDDAVSHRPNVTSTSEACIDKRD